MKNSTPLTPPIPTRPDPPVQPDHKSCLPAANPPGLMLTRGNPADDSPGTPNINDRLGPILFPPFLWPGHLPSDLLRSNTPFQVQFGKTGVPSLVQPFQCCLRRGLVYFSESYLVFSLFFFFLVLPQDRVTLLTIPSRFFVRDLLYQSRAVPIFPNFFIFGRVLSPQITLDLKYPFLYFSSPPFPVSPLYAELALWSNFSYRPYFNSGSPSLQRRVLTSRQPPRYSSPRAEGYLFALRCSRTQVLSGTHLESLPGPRPSPSPPPLVFDYMRLSSFSLFFRLV